MRVLRVVAAALSTVRVVDTIKEAIPVTPPPAVKSSFATAVAGGLLALVDDQPFTWRRFVQETGAAAGLAMMLHEVQWYLLARGDSSAAGLASQVQQSQRPLTRPLT